MVEFGRSYKPDKGEAIGKSITVYHVVTNIAHIPNIRNQGLIPGASHGLEYYGISTRLLDMFAPKKYKKAGVLRSNAVFAYFHEEEARNIQQEAPQSQI